MKINITHTTKKLYIAIAYDDGYINNHKIVETKYEAIKWCSKYGGCDTTVIPFELDSPHFGIHQNVKWKIRNHPDADDGE